LGRLAMHMKTPHLNPLPRRGEENVTLSYAPLSS
jgi:hypothetical protein